MSTVQNQMTQQQIDELLNQLEKNFDITKFQKLSYEDLQKLADKYLEADDQELRDLGNDIKQLDPKTFELSPAESILQQLHNIVTKLGKTKTEADRFGLSVLKVATEATIKEIVSAMSEETQNQWENLQSYEPNILQQSYLLNETSKILLGKSFDDIYENNLDIAVRMAASILSSSRENSELVKSLTDDQIKAVTTAFNANQYEIAIQLIYNYAQENAAITKG